MEIFRYYTLHKNFPSSIFWGRSFISRRIASLDICLRHSHCSRRVCFFLHRPGADQYPVKECPAYPLQLGRRQHIADKPLQMPPPPSAERFDLLGKQSYRLRDLRGLPGFHRSQHLLQLLQQAVRHRHLQRRCANQRVYKVAGGLPTPGLSSLAHGTRTRDLPDSLCAPPGNQGLRTRVRRPWLPPPPSAPLRARARTVASPAGQKGSAMHSLG